MDGASAYRSVISAQIYDKVKKWHASVTKERDSNPYICNFGGSVVEI